MPETINCGDYGLDANSQPNLKTVNNVDRDIVALSIHPGSLIDRVYVESELLTVGAAVFVNKGSGNFALSPARGRATLYGSENNSPLLLHAWKCGEKIVPAPKRAAYVDSAVWKTGAGGGGETGAAASRGTLGAAYKLLMTLPFFGRRHGTFVVRWGSTAVLGTSQLSLVTRGVRYVGRAAFEGVTGAMTGTDESAAILYTATDSTVAAGINQWLAQTIHVGGFDSEEQYDEVELWGKVTSAIPNSDVFVDGEATGERSQ